MQTTQLVTEDQIDELVDSIFSSGDPIVKEAYSDFDTATRTFPTPESLRADISYTPEQKRKFFYYSVHYPAADGIVAEKRINLNPGAVKHHTHRFCQEGWGLIFLQVTFQPSGKIQCCVSVNSEARANNWADTGKHLGDPAKWNWDIVNRHAGRLVRLLRKLGKC